MSDLPAYGMEFQDDDESNQMEEMEKELDKAYDDNKILSKEIELLRKRHEKLKETLLPVCEKDLCSSCIYSEAIA